MQADPKSISFIFADWLLYYPMKHMHKQAQKTTIFSYMSLPSPEHMSVKWVQVQVDLVRLNPKNAICFMHLIQMLPDLNVREKVVAPLNSYLVSSMFSGFRSQCITLASRKSVRAFNNWNTNNPARIKLKNNRKHFHGWDKVIILCCDNRVDLVSPVLRRSEPSLRKCPSVDSSAAAQT